MSSDLPTLVDTHCHVGEADYDTDRDAVLARARAAGVTTMIVVAAGGDLETNQRVIDVCDREPDCYGVLGVHPHHAAEVTDPLLAAIRDLARHPKVVGIGETGLDFHYDHSPRDRQMEEFRRFVRLAKELDRVAVIHSRNAARETLEVLREERPARVVLHCFTYGPDVASEAVGLGCHVSFSGIVTFRNAEELREAARAVPEERLLVETDSPWLAPAPKRGGRNEPCRVADVVRGLADALGRSVEETARLTAENARRLFGLP